MMLQVRINPLDVRVMGVIRARLLGGALDLSNDAYVRIRLDEPAIGTNCIQLGLTNGPVFVVGRLQRNANGELTLMARPMPTRSVNPGRPRHDAAYYDQYIVDPAYLSPEGRRRHEAKPHD